MASEHASIDHNPDTNPDYIRHVRHSHTDHDALSWCGQDVNLTWCFVSIDHAVYAIAANGTLLPCGKCIQAIVANLMSPWVGMPS